MRGQGERCAPALARAHATPLLFALPTLTTLTRTTLNHCRSMRVQQLATVESRLKRPQQYLLNEQRLLIFLFTFWAVWVIFLFFFLYGPTGKAGADVRRASNAMRPRGAVDASD